VPAIYQERLSVDAGDLMSYSGDARDAYYEADAYIGRVPKGERPADLPVQQTTKVKLVINLKTARALGLNVQLSLLGRADEVVE
jgi:putative ABC transport system substrate-binding protein